MGYYTVRENETLPEIVAQACPAWSVAGVRDHAKNAHLFQTRSEYMLKTGDQIWIPEEEPERKWFRVAAGRTYRFTLATPRRPFCVQLNTVQGKPLDEESYELEVDGLTLTGTTDREGLRSHRAPHRRNSRADHREGRLERPCDWWTGTRDHQ